LTDYY